MLSSFTGDIHYVPITKTSPANKYWGVDQVLTYGKTTTILKGNAGIMDTGSTLLLIATDAFHAYQKATGATVDRQVLYGSPPANLAHRVTLAAQACSRLPKRSLRSYKVCSSRLAMSACLASVFIHSANI